MGRYWTLFVTALVPRVVLLGLMVAFYTSKPVALVDASDTSDFAGLSRMILTGVRPAQGYLERLALGWPMLIAPFGRVLDPIIAAMALSILLASLLPIVYFKTTRSFEGAMLLAVLTPDWILFSTKGHSEPAMLLCSMLAVYFFSKQRWLASGVSMGIALLVRPTIIVLALGIAVGWAVDRDWTRLVRWGLIVGAIGLLALGLNYHYYGDVLHPFRQYRDAFGYQTSLFGWPIVSLVHGFRDVAHPSISGSQPLPAWKLAYVAAHLAVALLACAVGIPRRSSSPLRITLWIWAVLNTVLILSIGRWWGVISLSRYWLWAMPAYLYLTYEWLREYPRALRWINRAPLPMAVIWTLAVFVMEGRRFPGVWSAGLRFWP